MSPSYAPLLRAATSARIPDEAYNAALRDVAALPDDDMSYFAQMQRGNTLSHRTWLRLNEKRHRMRLAWDAFFALMDEHELALVYRDEDAEGHLSTEFSFVPR